MPPTSKPSPSKNAPVRTSRRAGGTSDRTPPRRSHIDHIEFIARGLIVLRGHTLVCWNPKGDYGYLPGGHVEPGEPAADALAREMLEEAGLQTRVGPLLLGHENTFSTRKRTHHELNLVFAAELIDPHFLSAESALTGLAATREGASARAAAADKARMFHVEHSIQSGIRALPAGVPPPPIASLEPHIAFRWLTASQFTRADIRPGPMAKWTLQVIRSGLSSTAGLTATVAPTAQWLSTID